MRLPRCKQSFDSAIERWVIKRRLPSGSLERKSMGGVQRRDFLIAAAALLAAPATTGEQPAARSHRLVFLGLSSPSDYAPAR